MNELNFPDKFLRTYHKNEVIFREGDSGSQMYVVKSGMVDICKSINGEEKVLKSLGTGEIFGEMSLIDNLPRSASVIAVSGNAQGHESSYGSTNCDMR